ncbi:hypothetical protein SLEP1_g26273 [Rubroshorea leprosula]|uniref:Uncharacterized protein n=1 Tax=Rubroshorea leprosula TaxID=152421 RepID=A0AAV5JRY9_9ROSI|nr:hypothetical protein SLEP1_g26273 [Rubroshorea leprosula]
MMAIGLESGEGEPMDDEDWRMDFVLSWKSGKDLRVEELRVES